MFRFIKHTIFLALATLSLTSSQTIGIYQVPMVNYPTYGSPYPAYDTNQITQFENYYERTSRVWYNYIRLAPEYFKNNYLSIFMKDYTLSNVFNTINPNIKKADRRRSLRVR